MNWKLSLLAGGVALACFSAPAIAQVHVYIGGAPPPMRREVRPAMPGPGYVWTEGYWGNRGGRYVWMSGTWQRPPYEGASWSHQHYDHYQQGWQAHEGHWDHGDQGNQRDQRDEGRR